MPGCFSLGLHPALEEIQTRPHSGDIVFAFFDDIFIITVPERTRACYDIVEEVFPRRTGSALNREKTRAWCRGVIQAPAGVAELGPEVWRADREPAERSLRVVGTPFGSAEFVAAFLQSRILEERRLIDALPAIRDPQCIWLITRLCAEPRANHILRILADPEAMITTTSFFFAWRPLPSHSNPEQLAPGASVAGFISLSLRWTRLALRTPRRLRTLGSGLQPFQFGARAFQLRSISPWRFSNVEEIARLVLVTQQRLRSY